MMNTKHFARVALVAAGLCISALTIFGHVRQMNAAPNVSFTVNSTDDGADFNPGDGVCETGVGNGICTLRAAIMETNALPGADEIVLPAGHYGITIGGVLEDFGAFGDLDIRDSLTINGVSAAETVVDGNGRDRVFHIVDENVSVVLNRLTIQHGAPPQQEGGGIWNLGSLRITNALVFSNTSSAAGGGISSTGTQLEIRDSTIMSNTSSALGGGIANVGERLEIVNSSILSNTSQASGGGVYHGGNVLALQGVTVAGNRFMQNGGGIYHGGLSMTLQNCVIRDNELLVPQPNASGYSGPGLGGGLFSSGLWIGSQESIINDCQFVQNDSVGGAAFALRGRSNAWLENITVTQNHSQAADGSAISTGVWNITMKTMQVYNNQADYDSAAAIQDYNSNLTIDGSQVYSNTGWALSRSAAYSEFKRALLTHLQIYGNSAGGIRLINGSLQGSDLSIHDHPSGPALWNSGSTQLVQSNLYQNGGEQGGAIHNAGELTIASSRIYSNTATDAGGAIYQEAAGNTIVRDSLVFSNAAINGGAFYFAGSGALENVTVTNNRAANGGAIYSAPESLDNVVDLANVTLVNNVATDAGGASLYNKLGVINMRNSLFVGANCSTGRPLVSLGYNLFDTPTTCPITGDVAHDLANVDPLLGPLQDNGGPTETYALLAGSPAIDGGHPDGCLNGSESTLVWDQRGYLRHADGNGDGVSRCDIGAVEFGDVVPMRVYLPHAARND
ncbi:MAG: choice-of-anchor Q domain-containing protein [Caldilineaceae bacterium]